MTVDPKRELLRHMVATVAFRGGIAVSGAPPDFATFSAAESARTPGEILTHIGDLLFGSHYLLRGEFVYLKSDPLPWDEEIGRFFNGVQELDAFLATDVPLAHPVEKLVQGPIGDALTHVGQIVLLRRIAGSPIEAASYFEAEITPGT
jgi:hypothetical protein